MSEYGPHVQYLFGSRLPKQLRDPAALVPDSRPFASAPKAPGIDPS